jgi:hypothetical protein
MSFPAPTLTEALKTLDYVIKRESNRLNRDVAAVFQKWYEPRKLDVAVASDAAACSPIRIWLKALRTSRSSWRSSTAWRATT